MLHHLDAYKPIAAFSGWRRRSATDMARKGIAHYPILRCVRRQPAAQSVTFYFRGRTNHATRSEIQQAPQRLLRHSRPSDAEVETDGRRGHRIIKLNIGNPAPFGFNAPDEIIRT